MKTTPFTELIDDQDYLKVHEDDLVVAMLDPKPVVPGHVIVVPREPHPILELTPDEVLAKMLTIANRVSMAMFEELRCTGTDILISNGIPAGQTVPHLSINVIPRQEDDGLDFSWKGKQLSQEELSVVEMRLREEVAEEDQGTTSTKQEPEATTQTGEEQGTSEEKDEKGKENTQDDLRLKRLDRIPRW
ncbi:MAG: HIT domain-containing protein [DPANN group archaeon]|nr:HIT domain-containing protein [DPANN group archaeon]